MFVLWLVLGNTSEVALLMFSVPGFVAGTVQRLRHEAANELAERGRELEEERELFAELAVRHERARIASELHDIVGHAISVMVIQAAAGQRLLDQDPDRARQVFSDIAESARQGHDDLQRLVELLGGTEVGGPDLSLIEEVVTRAARGGLDVSCRFEGERDGLPAPTAHVALRRPGESDQRAALCARRGRAGSGQRVRPGPDRQRRERPLDPGATESGRHRPRADRPVGAGAGAGW